MRQKVQVKRLLEQGYAEVVATRRSACSGDCDHCGGCSIQKQFVHVKAKNKIGAQPGDQVVIDSNDNQIFKAIFVVYVIPLVLLLAGYFIGYAIGWLSGLFAAAGFVLGVLIAIAYNRYVERHDPVAYTIISRVEV